MFVPVKLTASAIEMVRSIMEEKEIPSDYSLRIGIRQGSGCAGVNYILGFDHAREGDQQFNLEGIPVVIEKKQTMFLVGMTVDWVTEDGQQGFTFIKEKKVNS